MQEKIKSLEKQIERLDVSALEPFVERFEIRSRVWELNDTIKLAACQSNELLNDLQGTRPKPD
jgi:hypothetical protein